MSAISCASNFTDPLESKVSKVSDVIKDNVIVIAFAMLLYGVLAFVIGSMIMMSVSAMQNYYRSVRKPSFHDMQKDDEFYKSDNEPDDAATNNEYSRIQSKIAKITNTYHAYNREISKHTMNSRNNRPDDIIDRRILSRDDDDFYYGKYTKKQQDAEKNLKKRMDKAMAL